MLWTHYQWLTLCLSSECCQEYTFEERLIDFKKVKLSGSKSILIPDRLSLNLTHRSGNTPHLSLQIDGGRGHAWDWAQLWRRGRALKYSGILFDLNVAGQRRGGGFDRFETSPSDGKEDWGNRGLDFCHLSNLSSYVGFADDWGRWGIRLRWRWRLDGRRQRAMGLCQGALFCSVEKLPMFRGQVLSTFYPPGIYRDRRSGHHPKYGKRKQRLRIVTQYSKFHHRSMGWFCFTWAACGWRGPSWACQGQGTCFLLALRWYPSAFVRIVILSGDQVNYLMRGYKGPDYKVLSKDAVLHQV